MGLAILTDQPFCTDRSDYHTSVAVTPELRFADVVEGVRAALAAYVQALDDGRTDDIVATFCEDGTIDLPGMGTHTGHDALRVAYEGWKPRRPQCHMIVNTLVSEWSDTEARAVSDLVFVRQGKDGWSIQLVGRYTDLLHNDGGTWRFHHRAAAFEGME
jgi:ketosteroid isomerase-like protein